MLSSVLLNETVSPARAGEKTEEIVEVKAAGTFAMVVSTGGPARSSSPSSSALTLLSTRVADVPNELPGSK